MPVVLVVVSAAGGVDDVAERLVIPLQAEGWTVDVVPTPNAEDWMRTSGTLDKLEALVGQPITSRSVYPPERDPFTRRPDAAVVAPASLATVCKLAAGIADNRALTKVVELIGWRPVRPVVIMPNVNAAHCRHPAWEPSLARLWGAEGVTVLHGAEIRPIREPDEPSAPKPWDMVVESLPDPDSLPESP